MPRSNIRFIAALTLTATLTIVSCDRKTVYDRFEHVNGWERGDTVTFAVRPVKADGMYKEEVGLRINASYPFMGLCIIADQRIIPGDIMRSDTLNCKLIDKKGNAKGRGLSCFQYRFHTTSMRLSKGDSLIIKIRHNMKREVLPGIEDVGIRIAKD